ncbi:TetR/AcrR family transcriptional regulator [Sphingomonas sp. GB1N7]|uniref:TetR/AcrR family transcriptional regulator n=1 Tax=Parasphingomonas caseinilytica TaxID=3096158 RepID=UPI002FCA6FB4
MSTPSAYERKKEPEKVRRALLDAAGELVSENGLANVTLDAVAKEAGVTKGGLFHHFASKQLLFHGMFADIIDYFDALIEGHMARDPIEHGRFTRAYIEGVFVDHRLGGEAPSARLCISMLADPELQQMWSSWLAARIERHFATDGDEFCEMARLAADGVWLAVIAPPAKSPVDFERARKSMLRLTIEGARV